MIYIYISTFECWIVCVTTTTTKWHMWNKRVGRWEGTVVYVDKVEIDDCIRYESKVKWIICIRDIYVREECVCVCWQRAMCVWVMLFGFAVIVWDLCVLWLVWFNSVNQGVKVIVDLQCNRSITVFFSILILYRNKCILADNWAQCYPINLQILLVKWITDLFEFVWNRVFNVFITYSYCSIAK